jgi:transposase-like protein
VNVRAACAWPWRPTSPKPRCCTSSANNVAPGSTVYTDALKGWDGVRAAAVRHMPRKQPTRSALRRGAPSAVPLADRAIGNLQQWLIGTYHGVGRHHLQVYLDEFAFRHNRRKTPMAAFQTLLGLGSAHGPTPGRASFVARKICHSFRSGADHNIWGHPYLTG